MPETTDIGLLQRYVRESAEDAFAELVTRHVDLVYSVALRKTGNPHAAQEITQAVFIILARKADRLREKTILSAWLYQTARLTTASFLRTEIRRARREQEAHMETFSDETESNEWLQVAPLLEDAMGQLGDVDRAAVVLRFFEKKSFREVAAAFGTSENAAKKRVGRALEKLRRFLAKRGVVSTPAIIANSISNHSIQAAPMGLVKSATAAAITKGAATSGSTLTLIKGALKLMAWTKAKTAIVICTGVLLAAGTTTVVIKKTSGHETYPWQTEKFDPEILDQAPPEVRIVHSKNPPGRGSGISKSGKMMGLGQPVKLVVQTAYSYGRDTRFIFPTNILNELPPGPYDFIASLPSGNAGALQQEVKRRFGVVAKREIRETDVLLLIEKYRRPAGLRPTKSRGGSQHLEQGRFACTNVPLSSLADYGEIYLNIPVIDRTDLKGNFDFDLKWDAQWDEQGKHKPDTFKQALLDQLGLDLVPSREPIEMLVVEKVK